MALEPRTWVYEAVIYVPTGNYVNILDTSYAFFISYLNIEI